MVEVPRNRRSELSWFSGHLEAMPADLFESGPLQRSTMGSLAPLREVDAFAADDQFTMGMIENVIVEAELVFEFRVDVGEVVERVDRVRDEPATGPHVPGEEPAHPGEVVLARRVVEQIHRGHDVSRFIERELFVAGVDDLAARYVGSSLGTIGVEFPRPPNHLR